jgi:hypothetical protein
MGRRPPGAFGVELMNLRPFPFEQGFPAEGRSSPWHLKTPALFDQSCLNLAWYPVQGELEA